MEHLSKFLSDNEFLIGYLTVADFYCYEIVTYLNTKFT
jgi:hypothetical protein